MLCLTRLIFLLLALVAGTVAAQESSRPDGAPEVGVEEKLSETVPLDLRFHDCERNEVRLGDLIDRPTILLLVYYRCPSICSPLMNEVALAVGRVDGLEPGKDYKLITVSFDPREDEPDNAKVASNGKRSLLARMEKPVSPESWRFLTGSKENTRALADAVGFYFKQEDTGDYTHPATTIFLSPEGKIVRYLHGLELLPANVKLALIDAKEGRARSFMQKMQKFCFSYDPEGQTYVLQINRIIMGLTILILIVFLYFLLRRRGRQSSAMESAA